MTPETWDQFRMAEPGWLLLLLALPALVWWRGNRPARAMAVPFAGLWHRPTVLTLSRIPVALLYTGWIALVLALSRPQLLEDRREVRREGYDLMLAIDLSGSMLAEDYDRGSQRINRLQAIQPVVEAFIREREGDRIGIVVFSGRAYTLSPLTFDHAWLRKQVDRLKVGLLEDGTAIGDGIGAAISRLDQADKTEGGKRLGAFIVLLTDGSNNRGVMQPQDAAFIAQAKGVPIYTIGAGREGIVPMPMFDSEGRKIGYQRVKSDLDEETLVEIAQITGAKYFRAHDSQTVKQAFDAIDQAKKIEFQASVSVEARELFWWCAAPGGACAAAGLAWLMARRAARARTPRRRVTA